MTTPSAHLSAHGCFSACLLLLVFGAVQFKGPATHTLRCTLLRCASKTQEAEEETQEGKCKWSYGPSCPVDFPLNIHSFIRSSVFTSAAARSAAYV